RLHFIRDVAHREDASTIRTGHEPENMPPCATWPSTSFAPPDTATSPPGYGRCPSGPSTGR
ncbi:hypothetical protein ACFVRU_23080, partial [Streptomyces sp. NPDC057927]